MEIFADSEERHVQKKFLCVKTALSEVRKVSANEIFLIRDKSVFWLMQSHPIKKSFFQHTKISISHRTKVNEQLQILSAKAYCELAVQQFFFVKTSVLR